MVYINILHYGKIMPLANYYIFYSLSNKYKVYKNIAFLK